MAEKNNDQKNNGIEMKLADDKSLHFKVRDGITVRVAYNSPTQVSVEFWRETPPIIIPPDLGNIASESFRDRLVKNARRHFDNGTGEGTEDSVPHLYEDLGKIATMMGLQVGGKRLADLIKEEAGPSLVDRLVEMVEGNGVLFRTPEGRAHATITVEGHTETHDIRSTDFRAWLKGHFYATEREKLKEQAIAARERMVEQLGAMAAGHDEIRVGKPPVIRDQTIADAISQLESIALVEKRVEEVHLRIGKEPESEKFYIDLGNEKWDAVEIDASGWRIVETPPVRFVRANGMLPLPYPTKDGSIDDLKNILTLGEDDEHAWTLIKAWMVQAFRPGCGHYPILMLLGGEGTAKTNTTRMIRQVVDPSAVTDIRKPRSEEEIHIDAACSWVVALDNLSGVQEWLSDVMCRIATGSAMTKRTLYTDRDRQIFKARQPQIMNGIGDVATRADLLRRALLVNLPVIGVYREEEAVWAEFNEAHAGILGALLTAVSAGLGSVENGDDIVAKLPSMADFGKWAIRTEEALGGKKGSFMAAYEDSCGDATATVLESEPIVPTLFKLAMSHNERAAWVGTVERLRGTLNELQTDEELRRSTEWPKNSKALGNKLKRLAPSLKVIGIHVERLKRTSAGQRVKVFYQKPPREEEEEYGEV